MDPPPPAEQRNSHRALDASLELVRALRRIVDRLSQADRDLARQIRRAATSITLNLAEGSGRSGKDRMHCFRIAKGSALEVEAALQLTVAWGFAEEGEVTPALNLVRRCQAMIRGLLRGTPIQG